MKQLARLPILLQRALSPTELKRRQALHTKYDSIFYGNIQSFLHGPESATTAGALGASCAVR